MNEHDRSNLNFLLTASPEVLKDWQSQMDSDDLEYAQELLNMYAQELRAQSQELLIEAELAKMSSYDLANKVIDSVK
jgi:hypothetical protein